MFENMEKVIKIEKINYPGMPDHRLDEECVYITKDSNGRITRRYPGINLDYRYRNNLAVGDYVYISD